MPPNTAIDRGTVIAMSRFVFEDSGGIMTRRKRCGDRPRRPPRRPRLVGRMSLSSRAIFALTCFVLLRNPSPRSVLDIAVVSALGTDSETNDYDIPESARRSRSFVRKSMSEGSPARPRKSQDEVTLTLNQIFARAGRRGLGGGVPGAIAGVVQVVTLMWLRTIMSYQSRYGGTFLQALRTLLNEGGVARLYKGWYFGLIQAPVTRFVSTAANDGVESLLRSLEWTKAWGPGRTTIVASVFVGLFRMILMPIDTMKVVLQVDGSEGFRSLVRRLKAGKISSLYQGCIATALASMMGHYPWFFTYNWLAAREWVNALLPSTLIRNASIGLASGVVSDVVVNAIRVIKTTKQSLGSRHSVTYAEAVRIIVAADGWRGLFGRGLSTRIYCNAIQSIVFTVIWRALADRWHEKKPSRDPESSR